MRSRVGRLDNTSQNSSTNFEPASVLSAAVSQLGKLTHSGLFSGDHMLHKSPVEDASKIPKIQLFLKKKKEKQILDSKSYGIQIIFCAAIKRLVRNYIPLYALIFLLSMKLHPQRALIIKMLMLFSYTRLCADAKCVSIIIKKKALRKTIAADGCPVLLTDSGNKLL